MAPLPGIILPILEQLEVQDAPAIPISFVFGSIMIIDQVAKEFMHKAVMHSIIIIDFFTFCLFSQTGELQEWSMVTKATLIFFKCQIDMGATLSWCKSIGSLLALVSRGECAASKCANVGSTETVPPHFA
jgi:hypothetical protein